MEFQVIYTPDDDGVRWNARVKGKVNGTGCGTWGRSLREARANIRDAIATALEDDSAGDAAVLHEEFALPIAKRLAGLRARREKVEASVRELADESAEVARELQKQGYSMRDIAELVGTSHQRVQQWVSQDSAKPRKRARKVA
jgi:DNA-directed RNA polymerase specialized sigma24 family protein